MTTNRIIGNTGSIEQAGFQAESKPVEQVKPSARKKDSVEISRKNDKVLKSDATYSKESIQVFSTQVKASDNVETAHNLEEIKNKIDQGYYNDENVIDAVVDRIIDQLD